MSHKHSHRSARSSILSGEPVLTRPVAALRRLKCVAVEEAESSLRGSGFSVPFAEVAIGGSHDRAQDAQIQSGERKRTEAAARLIIFRGWGGEDGSIQTILRNIVASPFSCASSVPLSSSAVGSQGKSGGSGSDVCVLVPHGKMHFRSSPALAVFQLRMG